jgi:PTH1 family peptidyl-tRNA hydrolase
MEKSGLVIITCLGNPGKKYAKNRHTVGFMIGESIALHNGIRLGGTSFQSVSGKGKISGRDVLIMMPQGYMNLSGKPVKSALDFYRVPPKRLVVVHDEIEFPFGRIAVKFGGGHRGHNGIRSIINEVGTADFHRIRFGVGRPENPEIGVADHVLSDFTLEELERIAELMPEVEEHLARILEGGEDVE